MKKDREMRQVLFGCIVFVGICGIVSSIIYKKDNCCVDVVLEPIPKEPKKFVKLYNVHRAISLSDKEFDCLSRNIYWESRTEPLIGQIAVAQTTFNRVKDKRWKNNICGVVFQKNQFSWTNLPNIRNAKPRNRKQWERAKHSAYLFLHGVRVENLQRSDHYYANYIEKPKWAHSMKKISKIGQHIFYASK